MIHLWTSNGKDRDNLALILFLLLVLKIKNHAVLVAHIFKMKIKYYTTIWKQEEKKKNFLNLLVHKMNIYSLFELTFEAL